MTVALETASVPRIVRLRAMARLGTRMMFHDKLKFIGTISGVVFAVLLAVQQLSILFALLNRNTQFVDNAGADVFIVPPNTKLLQPGEKLHESVLYQARSAPGVPTSRGLSSVGVDAAWWLDSRSDSCCSCSSVVRSARSSMRPRPRIPSRSDPASRRSSPPPCSRIWRRSDARRRLTPPRRCATRS